MRDASTHASLAGLREFFQDQLLCSVLPFWLVHAIDASGGINTCIGDDGALISRDKYLWSQWRAVYTFSAVYNRFRPDPSYLKIADQIRQFAGRCGRDASGRWKFRVDCNGHTLDGPTSIYVDGFALIGLSEFIRATGDTDATRLAMETFTNVRHRLSSPGSYSTAPYEIPRGMKAHGVSMIFAHAFFELYLATGNQELLTAALQHATQIMAHFRRPERHAILEYVSLDGTPQDTPAGRAVVPGHAIESMWFCIHIFRHLGRETQVRECIECIRWHIESGWDTEYGGILLGLDIDGKEPAFWRFHETKLWWPHTEALYALLLAYSITGEKWALDWYWKVHGVAFKHYPVAVHGEWRQRLDRRFKILDEVVALPVKDPFHLPRALILSTELLRSLEM